MLNKLRELHLSWMHHPQTIKASTISGLQSLELLDMSCSAYKWDTRCNVEDGQASFDEILKLEQLSIVKLRLDKVESLVLDAAWLTKLSEFNIQISPGSCDSNHLATQHDEKRAILRGVDLSHRLSSLESLKSLSISKFDCITSLISGDNISRTIQPNLEHLSLNRIENLGEVSAEMIPKLRVIELADLAMLKSICSRLPAWPALEILEVGNCPVLTKLPFATSNGIAALEETRGELQWWDHLICSWVN
ncbi:hypothetical protein V6N13_014327 [Hibiscus sabdariffa]